MPHKATRPVGGVCILAPEVLGVKPLHLCRSQALQAEFLPIVRIDFRMRFPFAWNAQHERGARCLVAGKKYLAAKVAFAQ